MPNDYKPWKNYGEKSHSGHPGHSPDHGDGSSEQVRDDPPIVATQRHQGDEYANDHEFKHYSHNRLKTIAHEAFDGSNSAKQWIETEKNDVKLMKEALENLKYGTYSPVVESRLQEVNVGLYHEVIGNFIGDHSQAEAEKILKQKIKKVEDDLEFIAEVQKRY
jgi:hypothetical protein